CYLLQDHLLAFLQAGKKFGLGAVGNSHVHVQFLASILRCGIRYLHGSLAVFVVIRAPFGTIRNPLLSFSSTSALAVICAFSSPLELSMETRTSNVVTLSFSTPMGEILVTLPEKVRSLYDSTLIRAACPRYTLPISLSSTLPFT